MVNSKTQNRDLNAGVSRGFGIILLTEGLVSPYKIWKFLSRLAKTDLRTFFFSNETESLSSGQVHNGAPLPLMGFYYTNSFSESFLPELRLGWALKNLSSSCRPPLRKIGLKTDRMPFPPLSTKQLTKDSRQTNQGRDFNSFLDKILYNHVLGDSWDFCPWHHARGFMDLWNRITPHSWFLSSLCWCPHPPQLAQPSLQAHHLPHHLPP